MDTQEVVNKIMEGKLYLSDVEDYLREHPNHKRDFETDLMVKSIVYYENTYLQKFLKEYDPNDRLIIGGSDEDMDGKGKYSQELLALFHNHTELIEQLVVLSDNDVAKKIIEWSNEKDEFRQPLIENPNNFGNKSLYSKELKAAGLISCSKLTFHGKLRKLLFYI